MVDEGAADHHRVFRCAVASNNYSVLARKVGVREGVLDCDIIDVRGLEL